jgi:hypothetical protein
MVEGPRGLYAKLGVGPGGEAPFVRAWGLVAMVQVWPMDV